MAMVTKLSGSAGKKSGDMAIGESIEGYLLGTTQTKFNFAIKLLTKDGKVETLYPNGNLSYTEEEIENGTLTLNLYTKITRTGSRTSTKARDEQGQYRQVPVFDVAQDSDLLVSDEDAANALEGDKAAATEASDKGSSKFANKARR